MSAGNPRPVLPFTSAPLGAAPPAPHPMDVDDADPLASASAPLPPPPPELDPNDPQTWEEVDSDSSKADSYVEDEEPEEDYEELEDTVALEETEMHADARGVEEHTSMIEDVED